MMQISSPPAAVRAVPLTQAAFAPYGDVLEHAGPARRRYVSTPYSVAAGGLQHKMWISRVEQPLASPVGVTALERHVRSAQTFIPLTHSPYLVIVAPSLPDGLPDLARLQAFVASGRQGVSYAPGVWHHGLSAMRGGAEFVVTMAVAGDGGDDEFWPLPAPVHVTIPATLPEGA